MKVSVVMTTYNGENYVYEQLRSIYQQTRKPDEVLICDDCSTDKTTLIIQDFIQNKKLDNWRLTVNSENKGWQKNFVDTLREADGEYVFFSDQDDIWYNDKIEAMLNVMQKHPEILCLSGKMTTIDGNGDVFLGRNIFSNQNNTNHLDKCEFSLNFNTAIMQGCTMCIARKLADMIALIGINDFAHDVQACRLGILMEGTYIFDRPVIYYRLHDNNTSGVVADINFGSSNLQNRMDSINGSIIWLERLSEFSKSQNLLDTEKIAAVQNTISFQKLRAQFLSDKNIIALIKLLKYRKYYTGFSMYVGDFSYAFHINKITGKILWYMKKLIKI